MLQQRIDGIGFYPNGASHGNIHPSLKNLTFRRGVARMLRQNVVHAENHPSLFASFYASMCV